MSRGIPPVKEWRITMEDGRVFRVLGCTRRLAVLNLRAAPVWAPIAKIGLFRKQVGQRRLVVRIDNLIEVWNG